MIRSTVAPLQSQRRRREDVGWLGSKPHMEVKMKLSYLLTQASSMKELLQIGSIPLYPNFWSGRFRLNRSGQPHSNTPWNGRDRGLSADVRLGLRFQARLLMRGADRKARCFSINHSA